MDDACDQVRRGTTRRWPWPAIGLIVVCVYVAFPNARPDLTPFNCDDSEAYIGLAGSIADGRGYTRCLNPDQYIPHKTWPPGLPLLIAPVIRVFGLNLLPIKWLMCAIGLVGLMFFYLLIRDLTDTRLAGWATAATACSAHYFWFSHQVMSEVPTFAVSATALYLVQRVLRDPGRWSWWCAAGAVIGYGALIKGLALLLVITPLGAVRRIQTRDRRPVAVRYAVFVLISIVPTAAWAVRNSRVQAESLDAINQFRMLFQETPNDPNSRLITPRRLAQQIYENVAWGLIYRIPDQTLPLVHTLRLRDRPGGAFVALVLTTLVIVALIVTAWRRFWPLHLYVFVTLGLLSWFSTGGSARYFVPLAPMFILVVGAAVRSSRWWLRLGRTGPILACVWLGAAAVDLAAAVYRQETSPYADRVWAQFVDIARQARTTLPDDATVYVHNANAFTIVSGRRTWIDQPGVLFDLLNALRTRRITHLVVSRGGRPRDDARRQWVRTHPHVLKKVWTCRTYEVYTCACSTSRSVVPSDPP